MKTHHHFYYAGLVMLVIALLLFQGTAISAANTRIENTTARDDIIGRQQQAHIQSPTVATFPFYDGFESGTLGADWTISTTNQGRVRVDSYHPYTGTYGLLLDDGRVTRSTLSPPPS